MKERIHLILDTDEKERFKRVAAKEQKTLSSWLRDAAREKADAVEGRARLETREALEAFFQRCDERESGQEPDWEEHRRVIERSIRAGGTDT
jgi:hypothetical protein